MRSITLRTLIFSIGLFSTPAQAAFEDDFALVFFLRSTCHYCSQFSPDIRRLERESSLFIYAFSTDGLGVDDYPMPMLATGDILRVFYGLNEVVVPAVFLVNVHTQRFVQLTEGAVDYRVLSRQFHQVKNNQTMLQELAAGSTSLRRK